MQEEIVQISSCFLLQQDWFWNSSWFLHSQHITFRKKIQGKTVK